MDLHTNKSTDGLRKQSLQKWIYTLIKALMNWEIKLTQKMEPSEMDLHSNENTNELRKSPLLRK